MRNFIQKLRSDERGVSAIEYALIAAFIAIVIIGAVRVLGTNLSTTLSTVAASV